MNLSVTLVPIFFALTIQLFELAIDKNHVGMLGRIFQQQFGFFQLKRNLFLFQTQKVGILFHLSL